MTCLEITPFIGKTVRVSWIDPTGYTGGWCEQQDALDLRPARCFTLGIILQVKEQAIVIAGSGNEDSEDEPEYGDVSAIPCHCVTGIEELDAKA